MSGGIAQQRPQPKGRQDLGATPGQVARKELLRLADPHAHGVLVEERPRRDDTARPAAQPREQRLPGTLLAVTARVQIAEFVGHETAARALVREQAELERDAADPEELLAAGEAGARGRRREGVSARAPETGESGPGFPRR